jgi:GNAT superfamily N-acetyltransferase
MTSAAATSPESPPETAGGRFEDLFRRELVEIEKAASASADAGSLSVDGGSAAEPYVRRVPCDLAGIAISGGGIRSATFGLGVLQGLHELRLLPLFDYLSTVSGGGYVGAWWSAYRTRPSVSGSAFPGDGSGNEPGEVRHLREFSNHLAPRWGFFEQATWAFLSSLVIAALPTLIVAAAFLTLVVAASRFAVLGVRTFPAGLGIGVATLIVLLATEVLGRLREQRNGAPKGLVSRTYWLAMAAVAVSVGVLAEQWAGAWKPVVAWGLTASWIVLLRAAVSRVTTSEKASLRRAAIDRIVGRLLALCGVWIAALAIDLVPVVMKGLKVWVGLTGGAAAALLLVIERLLAYSPRPVVVGGVWSFLRRYVPQILAYLLLACALAWISYSLPATFSERMAVVVAASLVLLSAAVLLDPNQIGLHPFYRSRLARSYLGASNPRSREVASNRWTWEDPNDDFPLDRLAAGRPLHLLCCAANDQAGDTLATLSRGARSATLSRLGLGWADQWRGWGAIQPVSLGQAMTASAAAFNPAMGALSIRFGRATAFVLGALNARLGLWVPVQRPSRLQRWFPGCGYLRELFSTTSASDGSPALHLSDGGHFDNLGLYELLRRHCRYIVVCDASADPEVAFDDLGNALRRAREDFGIEIELDVSSLRPDPRGFSRHYVAVGDILYPNLDRGVIVLLKPTLIGDEPDDVCQYRARNEDFPHEATTDQFYDGAQWESYRRLGLHAARAVFGFSEDVLELDARSVLAGARFRWYTAPESLHENLLLATQELAEIDKSLSQIDAPALARGLWPEAIHAGTCATNDPLTLARVLPLFTRMMQLLENVYVGCELERHGSHPLNLGWMNLFGRWATAPLFRAWWPILSPMYGPDVASFAERTFGLRPLRHDALAPKITTGGGRGLASILYEQMYGDPGDKERFAYELTLGQDACGDGQPVVVEVAAVWVSRGPRPRTLSWLQRDFFVPPAFWGAGLGSAFLRRWIEELATRADVDALRVTLQQARTKDERKRSADELGLYRREGFAPVPDEAGEGEVVLERRLR